MLAKKLASRLCIKLGQAYDRSTSTHVPDSLLYAMLRVCIWDKAEISNGTVPDMLFWLRSRSIKLQASEVPMARKLLASEAALEAAVLLMI